MQVSQFSDLVGHTITNIEGGEPDSECVKLTFSDGSRYAMAHSQDCCENVRLNDVSGDIADLLNSPIVRAEENSNSSDDNPNLDDSFTWTFYRLQTQKGLVVFRWLGTSKGFYSEKVDFANLEA